jgi:hypothetical protein
MDVPSVCGNGNFRVRKIVVVVPRSIGIPAAANSRKLVGL